MTQQQGDQLSLISLLAAFVGCFFGFGLFFAPGWANGWQFLPQRIAWPAGMTAVAFGVGVAVTVGVGAPVCSRRNGGTEVSLRALCTWSVWWLVALAALCCCLYLCFHSLAQSLWP
jgi:hypothetical protein